MVRNVAVFREAVDEDQLVSRLGIEITECCGDLVRGSMPVRGNRQPIGILHGGASAVLAETLGSIAGLRHAGFERGGQAVGVELSCTHHRWVATGSIHGVCRPLYEGATVATYEITISDDSGSRTCTARLTCAIKTPRHARRSTSV